MNYKIFALSLFALSTVSAQVNFTTPDGEGIVSYQTKEISDTPLKTIGSPYIEPQFKQGKVYFNGEAKINGELRYNAYTSELELKQGKDNYTAILKRNTISAKIGRDVYKILPYEDENDGTRTGYFVILNNGKTKLLFKPEIHLRRGKSASTNYDRNVPPRYIDISSYYIQIGNQPARKIYLKKKYFYKFLDKEKVKNLIENESLRISKPKEAIKLIKLYNQEA